MSAKKPRIDYRPSSIIQLVTNHYQVGVPTCSIFHYDIKIERGRLQDEEFIESLFRSKDIDCDHPIVVRKLVEEQQVVGGLFYETERGTFLRPVFDGVQNLYTVRPIPFLGTQKINISCHFIKLDPTSVIVHRVRIRFATSVDFAKLSDYIQTPSGSVPLDAIRALDIILRYGPSTYQIPVGDCIFPKVADWKPVDIGKGKQMVSGHHQSIRATANGLSLVIDQSSTVFYKACDLVDFVRSIIKSIPKLKVTNRDPLVAISLVPHQQGIEENLKLIEKELKGLTIEVNHSTTKMKFKFRELTRTTASETFFTQTTDRGDRIISVSDFFKEKYSITLTYNNLPCAIVGNIKRPSYLPLEVCQLVAKQRPRTLSAQEKINFIKSSSKNCVDRFKSISESASLVHQDNSDHLREFSIDLSTRPLAVQGICLDIPSISSADESFVPECGKWSIKDKKVPKGCSIPDRRWFIVNFTKLNSSLVRQFAEKLRSFGEEKGAQIGEPVYWDNGESIRYDCDAVKRVLARIYERYQDRRIDRPHLIVFIITRSKDDSIYQEIKRYGDVEYGFNTQCVVESNLKISVHDKGLFILSNIFLKMNAKLGGTNNVIDTDSSLDKILGQRSTIVMGADVTHPTDKMGHSVAACVASFDRNQTKYSASVRLQPQSREEIIKDFPEMVYELLKNYIQKNRLDEASDLVKSLPSRLIFYRDGVSDGQFEKVLENEVGRMPEAFDRIARKYGLKVTYRPLVTCIVVQKRHHTRLMASNVEEKTQNIPSGTLVSEKIVATNDGSDFFLCSHSSSLGTSKPSHYHILIDENNFPHEDLYRLTFSLCHVYAKCTRVISIPAPVQYAHLAAFRARQHLAIIERQPDRKRVADESDREKREIEKAITIHRRLNADLYFI